ncbi:MAG: hypothetical protein KAR20_10715 [Candidatus Heimdallarchaeota archaeon]|nr:hypothetical protein [Candidatus Heimdallarchaeota archaeon]
MNNKKGISAVVATVLIILITVAAITIVWAAIIPMINNQLDQGTICLDAVSQLSILDTGYTCIDGTNLHLQIKKGARNFELADIQVLISSGGNVESVNLVSSGAYKLEDLPGSNEEKVFDLDIAGMGTVDSVKIAPIVKVGNTQETCSVSSTKTLLAC